jgi:hypothetical protein
MKKLGGCHPSGMNNGLRLSIDLIAIFLCNYLYLFPSVFVPVKRKTAEPYLLMLNRFCSLYLLK